MSTIKYTGGDLMQPRHIFKHLKREKSSVVETLPASLAGEEIFKLMKEQPVMANDVIEDVAAKPVKSKKKDDNDGDSTEE